MYISDWIIVIGIIIVIWFYNSKRGVGTKRPATIEDIENDIRFIKKSKIFSLEPFDSPHFIDVQDAFDVMEINYLRLKQKFFHTPEKALEIALDWHKYVESLAKLKFARTALNFDLSDKAYDKFDERVKEPSIIKEEIEKKFKSLLGEDWNKIPPDFFERRETMKKPDKETKAKLGIANEWRYYYRGLENFSENLYDWDRRREKEKEEREAEKQKRSK